MVDTVEVDDFDKAFAEVAAAAELSAEKVVADIKPAEEVAETPEVKAAREAAEKVAADAAKVKADADAAAAALAAETPEAKAAREAAEKVASDAAAAKVVADANTAAAVKAKAEADAAAVVAAKVETPEAKAAREAFELSITPYAPSTEEVAALAQFKKDFPNEHAAVESRLKSVDREINARVYAAVQTVMKHVDPRLTSVEATTISESAERHFSALHTAHSDYDAVIPKVAEWIKTQPAYLQPAMQAVYDGGTTQDVLALVGDYKKAAGVSVVDTGAVAAAAKAKADADAAKARAKADADALLPVSQRRTTAGGKGTPDQNDFDGAWAELAAASK